MYISTFQYILKFPVRKLADYSVEMTVTLRETNLTVTPPFDKTQVLGKKEITGSLYIQSVYI